MNEDEARFIDEPVFVPLPLSSKISTPRNKRFDTTFIWIVGIISGGLALWFFTNKSFRNLTGFNILTTVCIYSILTAVAAYFLLTVFVFRINEKVQERAVEGTANHNLALNEVWNISSGGLREEEFFNKLTGLVINYQGCPAFVYRTILKSVNGLSEGSDEVHYAASQRMLDTIMSNRYTRLKLNLKYDTSNDEIWQYTSDNVYDVSNEVGQNYVGVMNQILNHQFEYTKKKSKVSSTYHIIKLNHNSTVEEVVALYHAILNYSKQGSVYNIKLVNLTEFQMLIQRYYGFQNADFNAVISKSSFKETIGDSKVISLSEDTNNLFSNNPTEVKILASFYDNPYVEVVDKMPEDISKYIPEIDIFRD